MDQVINQALALGTSNYIHEAMERASAGMSRRAVESWPQLLDYVQRTPDEVWHLLTAGVEGTAQVFLARVANPTLRSILAAVLAILPGLGRGLADADARRAVLNGLRVNVEGPAVRIAGQQPAMARFFHSANLLGLAHRATYDAAGNPTGTSCQLVAHDRRAHRALNPERNQGGGRGQQAQVIPGAPYPESYPTLDEAGQMRLGLCGACFEGGSLSTTAAAPATTLFGRLNQEQRVRLLRVLMWIRRTDDATDDSIVEDLASADIEAVRTALGEGFGADNEPSETSVQALLAAAGKRPSVSSRVENVARRAMRAIEQRDFSSFWASVRAGDRVALYLLTCAVIWLGVFIWGLVAFVYQGWCQGDSFQWLLGALIVWFATLVIPVIDHAANLAMTILRGMGRLSGIESEAGDPERFRNVGRDIARFVMLYGFVGPVVIEMGFPASARVVLIGTVMLYMFVNMTWRRYGFWTKIRDTGESSGFLVLWSIPIIVLLYFPLLWRASIPFQPLRAYQDGIVLVEEPGVDGQVKLVVKPHLVAVTANPRIREEHDIADLFGEAAVKYNITTVGDGGVLLVTAGSVLDLPCFTTTYEPTGDGVVKYEWKVGVLAQVSDWYAARCYQDETQGQGDQTSAGSEDGEQKDSKGGTASANPSSERTYFGLTVWPAVGLLAGFGVVLMIVAGLVRGQGGGREAIRGVGTFGFLALVILALGILGYEGCQGVREDWKEAQMSEPQVERPAPAPTAAIHPASPSRSARAEIRVEDTASSAPLARVRTTEECKRLSPTGRDICLANLRKAQANRSR
jgi:hypothetical protein